MCQGGENAFTNHFLFVCCTATLISKSKATKKKREIESEKNHSVRIKFERKVNEIERK